VFILRLVDLIVFILRLVDLTVFIFWLVDIMVCIFRLVNIMVFIFWLVDLKVIIQFYNCIIIYCKIDVNNIIFKEKKLVWVDFLQFFEICFCHEDSKPTVQVSIVERVGWENIHDQVPSYPHVVIADNVSTPPSRSAIFILYLLVLTVLGIFPKATSQVATSQMCYF